MIGTDVVDIERFRALHLRVPELEARLFTEVEVGYCYTKADPIVSLAGTVAAKEATMKALGLRSLPAWARRIEIRRENGRPVAYLDERSIPVSISHDGGVATAVALAIT